MAASEVVGFDLNSVFHLARSSEVKGRGTWTFREKEKRRVTAPILLRRSLMERDARDDKPMLILVDEIMAA